MTHKRHWNYCIVVVALVGSIFAGGCAQQTALTPSPTPTITEVEISGFAFVPATITIPVGTTVTWFNKDSVAHTVSSREDVFDSGNLSGGATFSYTFDQNGSFEYYCKIHPYMKGEVIVE